MWMAGLHEEKLLMEQFKREERDKFYAQLDQTYLNILKMLIDKPHLGAGERERTSDQVIEYDAFAFIMWNFIESIYDYCLDDAALAETWHCIMQAEAAAHGAWFNRGENRRKFKQRFCAYIDEQSFCPGQAG